MLAWRLSIQVSENDIAREIVDAAYRVHTTLGPGLLGTVHETVMAYELGCRGLHGVRQHPITIQYDGLRQPGAFRADILVDDKVIVEIKSVEALAPVHYKQLLTYLRLAEKKLGLLINFNECLIRNGIHRVVNGLKD